MSSGAPQSGQKAVRGRKKTHTAHEASSSRKGRRRRKSEPEAESLTQQPYTSASGSETQKRRRLPGGLGRFPQRRCLRPRGGAGRPYPGRRKTHLRRICGKHLSITGRSAERSLTCPALRSRFVIVLRSFSGRRCGMPFCIYLIIGYKTIFFVISEEKMRSA